MMLGMTPEQWRAILATITTGLDGVRTFCTRAWPFFAKDTPDPLPDVLAQLKQQQEEI
jgi:hypothetical protein